MAYLRFLSTRDISSKRAISVQDGLSDIYTGHSPLQLHISVRSSRYHFLIFHTLPLLSLFCHSAPNPRSSNNHV